MNTLNNYQSVSTHFGFVCSRDSQMNYSCKGQYQSVLRSPVIEMRCQSLTGCLVCRSGLTKVIQFTSRKVWQVPTQTGDCRNLNYENKIGIQVGI